MESPVTAAKAALNPGSIIKFLLSAWAAFAVLDLLNATGYVLTPISALKAKFGSAPKS